MVRRSARLASLNKAKQAAEVSTLPSVAEHDNGPADKPESKPAPEPEPKQDAVPSSPARGPKTPGGSSPVKPPISEMHPSKVRPTMGPPSSGLRLGFTDIKPTTNRGDNLPPAVQNTPSRLPKLPSSPFTFRLTRTTPISVVDKLGPEAQRLMAGIQDVVVKERADLEAKRETEKLEEEKAGGRKIAKAKGKTGRFSAAHMAEFKKMDSIENHPSALRYHPDRITPLKPGVKRSQSKANLDEPERAHSKQPASASTSAKAKARAAVEETAAPAKRARQHIDDDASSKRSTSHDGSSIPVPKSAGLGIPRSKSNLASLMTPTKSSLARAATVGVKTPAQASLTRSPSKATLSGIPRSATTNNLANLGHGTEKEPAQSAEVKSPKGRFDRVKAMLRAAKASGSKAKSGLPLPSAFASKTPAPTRQEKELPPVPLTTPGRKLTKRVAFTPDAQRAAMTQNSPSPIKSAIPRAAKPLQVLGEVHYPSLDSVMTEQTSEDGVSYPDLSAGRPLPEPPMKAFQGQPGEPSVPGEFTFRSDHTISFGNPAKSFGSSPGQAGIRAVRPSILPTEKMPGSFPTSANTSGFTSTSTATLSSSSASTSSSTSLSSPNKENEVPQQQSSRSVFLALPHGMSNKKRHRASTDEEDAEREAAERAAKKRRQEKVPEGDALLAPRLTAANAAAGAAAAKMRRPGLGGARTPNTASPRRKQQHPPLPIPGQAPGTPSPLKKKTGAISMSRLNMLARPKMRK
ncbi:hypothetical protein VTK26DRAFT_2250 [Humicola hyalothermophila]